MNGILKYIILIDSLITFAAGMIGPIYAVFVQEIGGDILDASWAYFIFMVTSGVAIYVIGRFENCKKHKEIFIVWGYALTALGCLGYFFLYDALTLFLVQVVLGLADAFAIPATNSVYSHYVRRKEEASDWGLWEAMLYIIMGFSALVGGYLVSVFGFRMVFLIMSGFAALATVLSLRLVPAQD